MRPASLRALFPAILLICCKLFSELVLRLVASRLRHGIHATKAAVEWARFCRPLRGALNRAGHTCTDLLASFWNLLADLCFTSTGTVSLVLHYFKLMRTPFHHRFGRSLGLEEEFQVGCALSTCVSPKAVPQRDIKTAPPSRITTTEDMLRSFLSASIAVSMQTADHHCRRRGDRHHLLHSTRLPLQIRCLSPWITVRLDESTTSTALPIMALSKKNDLTSGGRRRVWLNNTY